MPVDADRKLTSWGSILNRRGHRCSRCCTDMHLGAPRRWCNAGQTGATQDALGAGARGASVKRIDAWYLATAPSDMSDLLARVVTA
jgi:hypothetical protein